jgi:uncharacterized membrane protein
MLKRLFKHLLAPDWWARRVFRAEDLDAITTAVGQSELHHRGEIRIAIESALPLASLLRNESSRTRAAQLFQTLGVANTREASGILLYIQLVEHQVEILADHGISARIDPAAWVDICHRMEAAFAAGDYRGGVLEAIDRLSGLLAAHFPATDDNPNELDNAPHLL